MRTEKWTEGETDSGMIVNPVAKICHLNFLFQNKIPEKQQPKPLLITFDDTLCDVTKGQLPDLRTSEQRRKW